VKEVEKGGVSKVKSFGLRSFSIENGVWGEIKIKNRGGEEKLMNSAGMSLVRDWGGAHGGGKGGVLNAIQ